MDIEVLAENMIADLEPYIIQDGMYQSYIDTCHEHDVASADILSEHDFLYKVSFIFVRYNFITEYLELKYELLAQQGEHDAIPVLFQQIHKLQSGSISFKIDWDREQDMLYVTPLFLDDNEIRKK